MKKTNLMTLAAITAGSAALWAVAAGPIAGLTSQRTTVEREPLERIIPVGTSFSELPEEGYYTVPFYFGPSTQDEFNECVRPEAECARSYSYNGTEKAFQANYTPNGVYCDYWAYLPGVMMEPGIYKFSCEYKTQGFKESFSVSIGAGMTPEEQTIPLISVEQYLNKSYVTEAVTFRIETAGIYYIGLHHTSDPNMYNVFLRNFTLEAVDTSKPESPEITSIEFVDGTGSVKIAVPGTDLDGNPLPESVNTHLLVNGEEVENSPFVSTPGEEIEIPLTLEKGNYEFSSYVSAVIGGEEKCSEPVAQIYRVTKMVIVPAPVPAYFACDVDEFEYCTILDANGDGTTWKFNETVADRNAFQYQYSSTNAANDYLIFPAIDCQNSGIYNIDFDYCTGSDAEFFKVFWVSDPSLEALQAATPIKDFASVKQNSVWTSTRVKTPVTESGEMYLVFQVYSPRYLGSVYLSKVNISVDSPLQIGQPSFGEISFEGGNGSVEVVLPSTTLAGQPLGEYTIQGELKINDETFSGFSGNPGETVSVAVEGLNPGQYVFSAEVNYTVGEETFFSDPISQNVQIFRDPSFAYQVPFDMSLKNENLAEDFAIYDLNNDEKTFTVTNDGLKYGYHRTNNADDWAIMLPMDVMQIDTPLEVTVTAKSSSYEEKFSVWIGTGVTVESMVYEVIPETAIKSSSELEFTGQVRLPATGKYRIGIHCTSDKDKLNLFITNLKVAYGIDDSLFPNPVNDLVVTPDMNGGLTGEISFTMPTETRNGTVMSEDEELTATVVCGETSTDFTGAPGAEISGTITVAEEGFNNIGVIVTNANGSSEIVETSVRFGLDTPLTPVLVSYNVSEAGTGVELTWEPVTSGVNDGVLNPELLQYIVAPWNDETQSWDEEKAIVTAETSCVYEGDPNAPQKYVSMGIRAFQSEGKYSNVCRQPVVMGKPLEMDVTEDFAGQQYNAGIVYSIATTPGTSPSWYITDGQYDGLGDSFDPENYVLQGSSYSSAGSFVLFPMVSSEGIGSAELTIEYWNGPNRAQLEGVVGTYGTDREIIGEVPAYTEEESGWQTKTFIIPESYMGKAWIQPGLFANFDNATSANKVLINSYSIVATSVVGTREVIASDIKVAGIRGNVLIGGAKGQKVVVSDLSGKVIFTDSNAEGALTIPAQEGIYVVKAGAKTFKVTVK